MGDISWSPAGESNKWELININNYRWITTERRGCASARTGKNKVAIKLKFKHEKRNFWKKLLSFKLPQNDRKLVEQLYLTFKSIQIMVKASKDLNTNACES